MITKKGVYLVQPQYLKNSNRYKFGMSDNLDERIKIYGKDTIIYYNIFSIINPFNIENILKNLLNEYVYAGNEYIEFNDLDELKLKINKFVNVCNILYKKLNNVKYNILYYDLDSYTYNFIKIQNELKLMDEIKKRNDKIKKINDDIKKINIQLKLMNLNVDKVNYEKVNYKYLQYNIEINKLLNIKLKNPKTQIINNNINIQINSLGN
jgi:hypothetical protein